MAKRIWERKYEILKAFRAYGKMSAEELIEKVDVRLNNSRRLCLYYYKQGLLSREKWLGVYHYSLADNGWMRLEYYDKAAEKHAKKQ